MTRRIRKTSLTKRSLEILYCLGNMGNGFKEHFYPQAIHDFMLERKTANEKMYKKMDKGYSDVNWYTPLSTAAMVPAKNPKIPQKASRGTIQVLIDRGYVLFDQDSYYARRYYMNESCRNEGGVYNVLFKIGCLDPFTPHFQKNWKKLIIQTYIRYCGIEKNLDTPTKQDIADFFKVSDKATFITEGLKKLLDEGSIVIVEEDRTITNPKTNKKESIKMETYKTSSNTRALQFSRNGDDDSINALLDDLNDTKLGNVEKVTISLPADDPIIPEHLIRATPKITPVSKQPVSKYPGAVKVTLILNDRLNKDLELLKKTGLSVDEIITKAAEFGIRQNAAAIRESIRESVEKHLKNAELL